MWFIFSVVYFFCSANTVLGLVTEIHPCHLSDTGSCLAEAIEFALHTIGSKGIQLLGLPAIDPIDITEIHIGEGASAVNLVQNYYNAKVAGFSKAKVPKAEFNNEKKKLTFTTVNDIEQKAKYNVTGKILMLPVFGDGDSKINLQDATIEHTIFFKEQTKNNKIYYIVDQYEMRIVIKGASIHFDNLFNGDKTLGDNILNVLNENSMEIFDDVKPGIEKSYAMVFKALANQVFEKIPAEEIFLI